MIRVFRRILLIVVAALAVLYAGDFVLARMGSPKNQETVTVQPYYAVPQKDRKTEFIMLDPQDQTCIDSMFPQMGYPPCWYLKRHTQKRIDM